MCMTRASRALYRAPRRGGVFHFGRPSVDVVALGATHLHTDSLSVSGNAVGSWQLQARAGTQWCHLRKTNAVVRTTSLFSTSRHTGPFGACRTGCERRAFKLFLVASSESLLSDVRLGPGPPRQMALIHPSSLRWPGPSVQSRALSLPLSSLDACALPARRHSDHGAMTRADRIVVIASCIRCPSICVSALTGILTRTSPSMPSVRQSSYAFRHRSIYAILAPSG